MADGHSQASLNERKNSFLNVLLCQTLSDGYKVSKEQTMSDVFVLGAGFSKAINKEMPTMDELGTVVRNRLRELDSRVQSALNGLGNNIELWMTYLSQPQPWLKNHENDYNRSIAGQIRQHIKEIIDDHTSRAARFEAPDWLNGLIKSWHARQATIITLNYDTLIERAARELKIKDADHGLFPENMYPPYFSNINLRSLPSLRIGGKIDTFSYLKLHGSVNWYYSGRDVFYGETIFYADVPALGTDDSEKEKSLGLLSKDKENLIIPPVNEKTTYFNNETVKGLWQDAGSALKNAKRVFVIGYSLPISDLGMRLFMTNNQPNPATPVYIVDTSPEVITRYEKLWPKLEINSEFAHNLNPVAEFVQRHPDLNPNIEQKG